MKRIASAVVVPTGPNYMLASDGPLDAEQWGKLLEIAEKTPVTRTLLAGAAITTTRG